MNIIANLIYVIPVWTYLMFFTFLIYLGGMGLVRALKLSFAMYSSTLVLAYMFVQIMA